MDWSQKRKIFYALAMAGAIVLIAAYPLYQVIHRAPTCSDQKQNGTETGVDCGGSCARACLNEIKPIKVVWAKAFQVTPGVYDLAAYIENENPASGIKILRYTIRAKDTAGNVLAEHSGMTELPPGSAILLFQNGAMFTEMADRVEVEFNKDDLALWVRAKAVPLTLTTKNQILKNPDTVPRLDATLVNNDLVNDMPAITVGAIIYDAMRHPVAVSHTYTTPAPRSSEQDIFFTWPSRFTKNPRGGMCPVPVDTMLVFDRSGSMDVGRRAPPEPLTTAKNAANAYVDAAEFADKLGVVSFATAPSLPIDYELSLDHAGVRAAVAAINIAKDTTQNTNLGDALKVATDELGSVRHTPDAKQVIVALTDGVANRPLDPTSSNHSTYAEDYAVRMAQTAKSSGIEMYVVGLGKALNETFLRDRIASDPAHYFNAPTAEALQSVYQKIAQGVCKPEGFITEIVMTPRAVFAN